MHVTVTLEFRFKSTPDGRVWTETTFAYPFWQRYFGVFDEVRVVGRVQRVEQAAPNWHRVDGERVSFEPLPYYIGPFQYLLQLVPLFRISRRVARNAEAVIMRAASPMSMFVARELLKRRHPFGFEILGDPLDVFAPGAVRHPLRRFFRWALSRELRHLCARAAALAYVTQYSLQARYPPSPGAYVTACSDIDLPVTAFTAAPRPVRSALASFRLVAVGSLAQPYKGYDILIAAVALCVRSGWDLRLTIVGDGKYRSELEELTRSLALQDRVVFRGEIPAGDAVRTELDAADLFVMPSRTEGLPRALIEAMARALPCIGSDVGGIPELLEPRDLVPRGDVNALAAKLQEVLGDPARMAAMSERNLKKAAEYESRLLEERRTRFYQRVREATETWLGERN